MIIFSFNLRGFGGPTKLASLKLLLKQVKPDIVFLQETLVDGEKAKHFFLQCFLTWNVVALDPNGRSGGLLSGWNPTYAEFCAFGTTAGIFLEGRFKHSVDQVKLLNCYAPYKEREFFWQHILDSGLLSEEGIIVGGDLNFTLSAREVWGNLARSDPLADYFSNILITMGLVDVQPTQLAPTWRNGRVGLAGISKRLDRFLIDENILGNHSKIRSWIINSSISDHNPICLQIEKTSQKFTPPFKFNSSWISDLGFTSIVRDTWKDMRSWSDNSSIHLLCSKLKHLKKVVIHWQTIQKVSNTHRAI
jgi:exonuclease III